MKKILAILIALTSGSIAFADTCSKGLTGVFTSFQAQKLCSSFLANFNQDLIPDTNDTYDLGSNAARWKDLYLSEDIVAGGTLAVTGASTLTGAVGAGAITSTGAVSGTSLTTAGTITSTIATAIGWSVVAGANTACNTTCTNGCVVGQDTGTANIFGACTDATADVCLCAGAS
jgi:hypothetical protein